MAFDLLHPDQRRISAAVPECRSVMPRNAAPSPVWAAPNIHSFSPMVRLIVSRKAAIAASASRFSTPSRSDALR